MALSDSAPEAEQRGDGGPLLFRLHCHNPLMKSPSVIQTGHKEFKINYYFFLFYFGFYQTTTAIFLPNALCEQSSSSAGVICVRVCGHWSHQ